MAAIRYTGHKSITQVARLCRGGGPCYPKLVRRRCAYFGITVVKKSGVAFIADEDVTLVKTLAWEWNDRVRLNRSITRGKTSVNIMPSESANVRDTISRTLRCTPSHRGVASKPRRHPPAPHTAVSDGA